MDFGGNGGNGIAFRVTTGGSYTSLHCFGVGGLDEGHGPNGLIVGLDGNFYGTTSSGGLNGYGAVFEITPQGTTPTIYSFLGSIDGSMPNCNLLLDADGNFYGTTSAGGAGHNGTLFRITPTGTLTVVHSFAGGTDDVYESSSGPDLIQGTNGIIYGTTQYSGSNNTGAIFQVNLAVPELTSAATTSGTVGVAFAYQTTASELPVTFSATNLPAGLSLNSRSGRITGTPTTSGTTVGSLTVTNSAGTTTTPLTITINPAVIPAFTSLPSAFGQKGGAFSFLAKASGNPTSYSATGLPAGLAINSSTGAITGTPSAIGTTTATLSATNGAGPGTAPLTFQILNSAPTPAQKFVVLDIFGAMGNRNFDQRPNLDRFANLDDPQFRSI
jgi:uncharacterized repeat protein (TIGR03803 family)